jgi:hypothetical protein
MSIKRMRAALALGAVAAAALVASAVAQTGVRELPRAMQQLLDCRKVATNSDRLACYDAAVDEMSRALTKGDVVAVDHEQVAAVRRQAFGFSLPSLSLFDHGDKSEASERITAQVAKAYQQPDGKWVLELDDGAAWVQTDDEKLGRWPRAGSKAEIRRAAMGSFFINLDGQRAIRARRLK